MGDFAVDRWKLEGCLFVWHYPRPVKGIPGWHLSADPTACQSIANLLDVMLAADWKTNKRLSVSTPKRMLVGRGNHWEPVSTLRIWYPKGEVEENYWTMTQEESGVLSLTVGAGKMSELKQSLLGLPNWEDDFALGPEVNRKQRSERERFESECLWFWTKVE